MFGIAIPLQQNIFSNDICTSKCNVPNEEFRSLQSGNVGYGRLTMQKNKPLVVIFFFIVPEPTKSVVSLTIQFIL